MTTTTLVRTVEARALPVAGPYVIDPAHSSVTFTVRHLGLSKVRGRFTDFAGQIDIADDPAASTASVSIDAASFGTGNDDRDGHVKSADFLDVEQFPTIEFTGTGVRRAGDDWLLDGRLTIKGVTKSTTLTVEFEGAEQDPWGNGRIAFTAETEIDRTDYGISWNQALETGGLLVGKTVKVSIDVQAVAA